MSTAIPIEAATQHQLQTVADQQAICKLIYLYCRSVDRLDRKLGYSIWYDDSTADYGAYYQGSGYGVIDRICDDHLRLQSHSHQVTNILIEICGNSASSEAYVTANLRLIEQDKHRQITVWGRYIDSWSRRNDRWGIYKRRAILDLDEIRNVTPVTSVGEGRRDFHDVSYAVLSQISGTLPFT